MPQFCKHYSKDLKQHIIYQSLTLGYSTMEIAKNLDMSLHVVRQMLQLWRENGNVVQDPQTYARQDRAQLLDTGCIEVSLTIQHSSIDIDSYCNLLALLDQNPDIFLDEILDQLSDQLDISVSLSTVHRTLKLLGITSKKVCLLHCIELNC